MSEFKSPKDCREPEYQEFALSRWKNLSDEEKEICLENKKNYANDNLLQIPESVKENLYRRMWGMPLVEGEEWGSNDLMEHIECVGISACVVGEEE